MKKLNIITEPLTLTEEKVYRLNGLGMQIKEIAEKLQSSYETVKSHMKSIKGKLRLQKDKEVTAHFWCNLVGENMDEVKKQIIASLFLILFIYSIPFDTYRMRENRVREFRARSSMVRRNDSII